MIHELLQVVSATDTGCGWFDVGCIVAEQLGDLSNGIGAAVAGATESVLLPVANSYMAAWAQFELYFLASWIRLPLLTDISDPNGTSLWLQDTLSYFTFIFAVVGALVAAAYTFIKLGPERIRNLGWRLGGLLLISIAGAPAIAILDRVARNFSIWLLDQAGITATAQIANQVVAGLSPGIFLIIGIIATIGVMIQWGIMIARGALVPVLVGVWPLSASVATLGGNTAEAAFSRITAWLVAFVIYPLPAAIVYAAAFRLKSGHDGLGGVMYGFVLEIMAIFMLPAILRLIAPATQALGEAFGGKIALDGAITAAETMLAVGAAVVTAGAVAPMFAGAGAAGAAGASGGAAGTLEAAPAAAGSPAAPAASGSGSGGSSAANAAPAEPGGANGANTPTGSEPRLAGPGGSQPATPETQQANNDGSKYAAQMAAQSIAQGGARAARDGLNDADEIIGGKHG